MGKSLYRYIEWHDASLSKPEPGVPCLVVKRITIDGAVSQPQPLLLDRTVSFNPRTNAFLCLDWDISIPSKDVVFWIALNELY